MNQSWSTGAPRRYGLVGLLVAGLLLLAMVVSDGAQGQAAETQATVAVRQSLTETERAWLKENPVIRVAQDPAWPPIEFSDSNHEPSGISEDYLQLIEQRLGVKFERVRGLSWQEAFDRLQRWEIDMTTSVSITPEREQFWAFTRPYMRIPIVIVARTDVPYIGDMQELAGKKVAVVDGYAVCNWVPKDFPAIELIMVKTVQEGLETLHRGDAFAFFENMLVVGDYLTKMNMTTTLKIVGNTPYVNAQSMAVRKDWAPLAGILDKALDSISETERNEIYRRWLPVRYEHGFDYTLLWWALGIVSGILLVSGVWIWRLAREIERRMQTEEQLRFQANIIESSPVIAAYYDKDHNMIWANRAYQKAAGLSLEEIRGRKCYQVWNLSKPCRGCPVITAIETGESAAHELTPDNQDHWPETQGYWLSEAAPVRDEQGAIIGAIEFAIDITERKRAEAELADEAGRRRRLMEQSRDGIVILDQDGQVVESNRKFAEMLGHPLESMGRLNVRDWEFLSPPERLIEMLQSVDEKGDHFETRHRRRDGSLYDVEISTNATWYAGQKLVLCICRDITDRKQAEEKMAKQLNELQRWHAVMLDREDRIIELKREINEMLALTGQPPRYPSAVENAECGVRNE